MLRVVGVGGAGVNAINRMVEAEIEGVEFLAINTDLQSLQQSARARDAAHRRLDHARPGLGLEPRARPRRGARGVRPDQGACSRGSDMVFIAAGAGGGTGTGAAPIVAQIARELGALTVGIVTTPVPVRGHAPPRSGRDGHRRRSADEVDTLIVVPNNRLLSVLERNVSMVDAFRVADDVLRQGVQGISDLVTLPGLINLDFADVRTIMSDAGTALLGIGMGTGERRAIDAAEQAVASPLLETSMEGARSILLSITGGHGPVAVGGQRGGQGGGRGGPPGRQHHLRRDGRREARRPGVGHGGRHRLRRRRAAAPRATSGCRGPDELREPAGERAARCASRAGEPRRRAGRAQRSERRSTSTCPSSSPAADD